MGDQTRAPEEFSFSGDLSGNWKLWKQKFDLYLIASGKTSKADPVKIAILLNLLGDEAIKIYNTFEYEEDEEREKLATILSKFEAHFNPTKNLVYEHFKFFKREQLSCETIDQFITALKQLASTCDFKEKDVLIRDRIVLGVKDPRIQEKLLQSPDLKLTEAINICRSMEASVATQKEISKDTLYDVLKNTFPKNLSKIVPITGDVMKLELGLSSHDKKMLIEEVNIVYHIAASVRFDDPLKDAVLINTRGTRDVARLAKEMKNLEVLFHFSTTYCHTDMKIVKEQLYPPHADWKKTIELAERVDSHVLNVLTEKYIQPLVNTYTFTKSLGEQAIYDLCDGQIPSIILRPSIVISTMTEPFPGWIDNFNGPIGILVASGKGVMRTSYANRDIVADYIPCDSVVKAVIMATWNKGIENDEFVKNEVSVYNASSYNVKSVTYNDIAVYGTRILLDYPLNYTLWHPNCAHRSSWYVFYVEFICFQLLPALFVDTLLAISRRKPMLIRIQRKIYLVNMALTHFLTNQWTFLNTKTLDLENKLLPSDFPAFNYETNHKQIDTYNYFTSAVRGVRKYLLKESDDTLEQAKAHFKRMRWISQTCGYLMYFLGILILFFIYNRVDWVARRDDIYAYFNNL